MINFENMNSIIDIKISFSESGFGTFVTYTKEALGAACDAPRESRELGFVFPIHAPSRLQFSFDDSLKGWKFAANPVRFITPPGEDFSAPIFQKGIDKNAPQAELPERFMLIDYWNRPGSFIYDIHMIDPSGNKIVIDPTNTHGHP